MIRQDYWTQLLRLQFLFSFHLFFRFPRLSLPQTLLSCLWPTHSCQWKPVAFQCIFPEWIFRNLPFRPRFCRTAVLSSLQEAPGFHLCQRWYRLPSLLFPALFSQRSRCSDRFPALPRQKAFCGTLLRFCPFCFWIHQQDHQAPFWYWLLSARQVCLAVLQAHSYRLKTHRFFLQLPESFHSLCLLSVQSHWVRWFSGVPCFHCFCGQNHQIQQEFSFPVFRSRKKLPWAFFPSHPQKRIPHAFF